jgi:hypothetical protein
MKNYKTNKECYKFYENNIKNKIVSDGIAEDVFIALKELYYNVNFHEVSDGATKNRNNELEFREDSITFLNYSHKCFKSTELNPCFHRENVSLLAKMSKTMISDNVFRNCVDIILITHISKRSKVKVRYKVLINNVNYRHIEKFMKIYEMSKQLEGR